MSGLSAIGRRKCEAQTVAMGRMAVKSVILQSHGTKGQTAKTIIAMQPSSAKSMLHLKPLRILGTSMKKLENWTSLEVAPHVMLISNICASSACDTCRDRPPKKMASMGTHLKFSSTAV